MSTLRRLGSFSADARAHANAGMRGAWVVLGALVSACAPKADAGPDRLQAGFDTVVVLHGAMVSGAKSYEWRQIAGPPVKLERATTPRPYFKTRAIGDVIPLSPYPGTVAIGQQPVYRFELTVRGRFGGTSKDEMTVTSASPMPGGNGIPLDTDIYMNGGVGEKYLWSLTPPGESKTKIVGEHSRTPHFRPDVKGAYLLVEEMSHYNTILFSGRYDTIPKDCSRPECHPKEQEGWEKTKHAHVARHEPECVRCHTVGFDPGASNGGFDEACPNGKCEGDKAVLGVIYCLACHGPGSRSHVNFAEGSCQQCHDAPPKYTKVQEWRQAKMARLTPGLEPNVQSVTPGCPDCHSSQGFVRWMKGNPGRALGFTYASPVACPTCHDPHSAQNPKQLRVYGKVKTRSGLELDGIGAGALCSTCHNAGEPREKAIAARHAPHAPQSDLLFAGPGGGNTAAAGPSATLTEHMYAEARELCVSCHVRKEEGGGGHTFAPQGKRRQEAQALRKQIEPLLAAARTVLASRVEKYQACGRKGIGVEARNGNLVVVGENGFDLGDCDRDGKIAKPEVSFTIPDPLLARDAYDFFFIERDRSFGYHNPAFARATLERLAASPSRR